MPALVKPTPTELKDILLLDGWRVHQEDLYNWAMVKNEVILVIPKRGKNVTFEVLYHALEVSEIAPGKYLSLREQVILGHAHGRENDQPPYERIQ